MSYKLCRSMYSNKITSKVTADCEVNVKILLIKWNVEGESRQNTNIKAIVTGQTLFNKER